MSNLPQKRPKCRSIGGFSIHGKEMRSESLLIIMYEVAFAESKPRNA